MIKVELKENLFHGFKNYKKGEVVSITNENELPAGSYVVLGYYENKMIDETKYLRKNKKEKK